MQKIQITEAKKIAERIGAEQVIMIAFSQDDFAITSYGVTQKLCHEAAKWAAQIADDLKYGAMMPP